MEHTASEEVWTEVEQLRFLTCRSAGITDLEGLQGLTQLNHLSLVDNRITNLTPPPEPHGFDLSEASQQPNH